MNCSEIFIYKVVKANFIVFSIQMKIQINFLLIIQHIVAIKFCPNILDFSNIIPATILFFQAIVTFSDFEKL